MPRARSTSLALLALAACTERSPVDDAALRDVVDVPRATDQTALDAVADDRRSPDDADAPRWGSRCDTTSAPLLGAGTRARSVASPLRLADAARSCMGPGVFRMQYRDDGREPVTRPWAVVGAASQVTEVISGASGERALLCTPYGDLLVDARCRVSLRDPVGRTLFSDGEGGGWSREQTTLDGRTRSLAVHRWAVDPDDRMHGFGERNGPFERRGTRAMFWNTDPYDRAFGGVAPGADPLYPSIPFWITHRDGIAWGTLLADAHRTDVQVADALTARVYEGVVDQFVFVGPRMSDVLQRYAGLTGHPAMPPRWALGYHQSRWGYDDASRFESIGARFRALRIPADAALARHPAHARVSHLHLGPLALQRSPWNDPTPCGARLSRREHRRPGAQGRPRLGRVRRGSARRALPAALRRRGVRRRGLAGPLALPRLHPTHDPRVVGGPRGRADARRSDGRVARRERAHGVPRERRRERARRAARARRRRAG